MFRMLTSQNTSVMQSAASWLVAPCQPFSSLTAKIKSHESDARWTLIEEFLRIILEGRPEIVSMENVPQLMDRRIYGKFKQALEAADYKISDAIVSCAQFGVPQSRRRLVMLASLLDKIDMPKPNLIQPGTVRQAIEKLPPLNMGNQTKQTPSIHLRD